MPRFFIQIIFLVLMTLIVNISTFTHKHNNDSYLKLLYLFQPHANVFDDDDYFYQLKYYFIKPKSSYRQLYSLNEFIQSEQLPSWSKWIKYSSLYHSTRYDLKLRNPYFHLFIQKIFCVQLPKFSIIVIRATEPTTNNLIKQSTYECK